MVQVQAIGAVILYCGVVSFVLLKVIGLVMPLRTTESDESTGLDLSHHGEVAYLHTGGTTSR